MIGDCQNPKAVLKDLGNICIYVDIRQKNDGFIQWMFKELLFGTSQKWSEGDEILDGNQRKINGSVRILFWIADLSCEKNECRKKGVYQSSTS